MKNSGEKNSGEKNSSEKNSSEKNSSEKNSSEKNSIAQTGQILFALVFLITGIGLSPAAYAAQTGGVAHIGAQADSSVIGYPPTMLRTTDTLPAGAAIETLFRFDEQGLPQPFLATGYTVDAETNTITLDIRDGVSFHDGSKLDAAAVKWNLEQFMATERPDLGSIDSIEIASDTQLVLKLKNFDNTIIGNLATSPGMLISPTAFEKNGKEWAERNPVGTGPFKFVSWEKDVRQVYEKFDGYWQDGKPYLDGLEWVFVSDPLTMLAALRSGEIDSYTEISPADAMPFMDDNAYSISRAVVGVGGFGIVFDTLTESSPFSKLAVRQAALHAIDLKTIVERLTRGLFDQTNQLVAPSHWAYNPDVTGYAFDPDKAKALLAEAGYAEGFKTKLTSWNQPPLTVDAFTAVQGYLADVGIDAEMELIDRSALVKLVVGGTWEGLFWAAPGAPNPDATRAFIADLSDRSKYWKLVDHPPAYEAALKRGIEAVEFEDKRQATFEAAKVFFDEHALMIPLWSRADLALSSSKLNDHGLFTLTRTQWTPADAWLDQ